MTSTIHADKIMNSSGDQDSGVDLLVNDQVKLKTANTDRVTVTDATTTVANTLAVTGASTLSNKLTVSAADGVVDNDWVMDVRNDEQTDNRSWGLRISAGSTSTDRALDVLDHAQANTLLRVNGAGVVIKPKQPAFCADGAGNSPADRTISSHGNQVVIPFPTERFDIGNNYNNSTYIFTAPVAGRYLFGFHLGYLRLQANMTIYPEFMVNGSSKGYYYFVDRSNAGSGTETAFAASGNQLINLAASDTVNLRISGTAGSAAVHYYLGANEATFWGYLVG